MHGIVIDMLFFTCCNNSFRYKMLLWCSRIERLNRMHYLISLLPCCMLLKCSSGLLIVLFNLTLRAKHWHRVVLSLRLAIVAADYIQHLLAVRVHLRVFLNDLPLQMLYVPFLYFHVLLHKPLILLVLLKHEREDVLLVLLGPGKLCFVVSQD